MKISKVEIENFMAIGSAEIALADRGLMLIQGENLDDSSQNSNGAGKSTVVDALCWALYGNTAREESGDAVINTTAGKNCRVSVTIDDDGTVYEVIRHRKYTKKANSLELYQDGVDMTKGTDKLTQQAVDMVVGASYQVFRASVYAGQDSQIDLLKMTDKFLKQIVEEAAGIDRLQAGHELAKERRNEAKQAIDALERESFKHRMVLDESEFYISEAKRKVAEFEEQREDQKVNLARKIDKQKKDAGALVKKLKGFDVKSAQSEYEQIINKAVDEAWTERRKQLSDAVTELKDSVRLKTSELDALKSAMQKSKAIIQNANAIIGTVCDDCGRPFTADDVADQTKKARENVAENLPVARKLSETIKSEEAKLSEATQALEKHDASVTVTNDEKERRDALSAQIEEYKSGMTEAKSIKQKIADLSEQLEQITNADNPHKGEEDKVQARIDDAEKEIAAFKSKMEEAQRALEVAEGVVEVFGNTGVRAHILDTVTPYLNERTAEYLTQLSDGNIEALWSTLTTNAKGELREKFSISVESKTGGKKHGLLSGGEKRKVRLATNLALQDLVATRASKPIDLYIGDEIDDALDSSGLERLMNVLEERAKARGTVLVISHNELSDWINEVITVVKEDGYATFEDSAA